MTDGESSGLDRAIEGGAALLSQTAGGALAVISPEAGLAGPAVALGRVSYVSRGYPCIYLVL
jgi:hypothetical protein